MNAATLVLAVLLSMFSGAASARYAVTVKTYGSQYIGVLVDNLSCDEIKDAVVRTRTAGPWFVGNGYMCAAVAYPMTVGMTLPGFYIYDGSSTGGAVGPEPRLESLGFESMTIQSIRVIPDSIEAQYAASTGAAVFARLDNILAATQANVAVASPFVLSLDDAARIGLAVATLWAVAFGIRMLIKALQTDEKEES